MLHVGVLPNHRHWGDVLANLAWIVVDEAHVYRGVFGSHVANVLRRLRRLARAYGTEPRTCSPAPRSPTRPSWPSGSPARSTAGGQRRRPAPRPQDRHVEPAAARREAGHPRLAAGRGRRAAGRAGGAGRADDLLPQVAPRRGAGPALHALRLEDPGPGDLAERIAPYRAGYTPPSGARSSSGWSRATCSPWWPPTRWSWASTSASWTPRSA